MTLPQPFLGKDIAHSTYTHRTFLLRERGEKVEEKSLYVTKRVLAYLGDGGSRVLVAIRRLHFVYMRVSDIL